MPELVGIILSVIITVVALLAFVGLVGLYAAFWMWLSDGETWGLVGYLASFMLPILFAFFYFGKVNFFG